MFVMGSGTHYQIATSGAEAAEISTLTSTNMQGWRMGLTASGASSSSASSANDNTKGDSTGHAGSQGNMGTGIDWT
jgi:hypothetical protein